jgi:hypothetical protein
MMVASKMTYLYVVILILFGVFFHFLQKVAKHYDWWEYVEAKSMSSNSLTGLDRAYGATENGNAQRS